MAYQSRPEEAEEEPVSPGATPPPWQPSPWLPPPERCDIRTCALPATRRYWLADMSGSIQLCEKHSHVLKGTPVPGPAA